MISPSTLTLARVTRWSKPIIEDAVLKTAGILAV
jgi:hypothetical protein